MPNARGIKRGRNNNNNNGRNERKLARTHVYGRNLNANANQALRNVYKIGRSRILLRSNAYAILARHYGTGRSMDNMYAAINRALNRRT